MAKTRPDNPLPEVSPYLLPDVLLIIVNFVVAQLGLPKAIGVSRISKNFESFFNKSKQSYFSSQLKSLAFIQKNRISRIEITDSVIEANHVEDSEKDQHVNYVALPNKIMTLSFDIKTFEEDKDHARKFADHLYDQFQNRKYYQEVTRDNAIIPLKNRDPMKDPLRYSRHIDDHDTKKEGTFVCKFRIKLEKIHDAIEYIKSVGVVTDKCTIKGLSKKNNKNDKCTSPRC